MCVFLSFNHTAYHSSIPNALSFESFYCRGLVPIIIIIIIIIIVVVFVIVVAVAAVAVVVVVVVVVITNTV